MVPMAFTAMTMLSNEKEKIDVMIINVHSPDLCSFSLLAQAVALDFISLVICDEYNEHLAVKALNNGAYLFLEKPLGKKIVNYLWQFLLRQKNQKETSREGLLEENDLMNVDDIGRNNIIEDNEKQTGEKNNVPNIEAQSNNIHEAINNIVSNEKSKSRKERCGKGSNKINKQKRYIVWTVDLHTKFMEAVQYLGEGRCYPQDILKIMYIPDITRMQIASHLQMTATPNVQVSEIANFSDNQSLCYVGGDTRIVVADRQSSLSDLQARLSHTLLNGRRFSLKYQLPNEDLDSLVSVTTDEDLDNMIEEYDRAMSASPLKPSRLRLFLFLAKPETAASMGCLLADSKSETWFVDALNNASMLSRGLSDSAADGNFLELESIPKSDSGVNLQEAQNESLAANNREMAKNVVQEVQSTMPDSPMVETTSSFESSVSSPSMPNLPPIKVRAEDGQMNARFHEQMLGLDEQLSHMNVASNAQKMDDGYLHMAAAAATPPLPNVIGGAAVMSSVTLVNTAPATGEHHGRIISDDEKSDHGAPSGHRKPPLPLQPIQRKVGDGYSLPSPDSKHAGGYNLQSPDSVASDSSIASGTSFSKHTVYQDAPPGTGRETRVSPAVTDPKNNIMDYNSQIQMQQVQDSVVMQVPQQQQQQQFVPANAHYIQHTATGPVAIPSYYQMYAPPTQQPLHQQMDQQYQMYYVPVPQTQPYNLTVQSNSADATAVASSQQLTPPNPTMVSSSAVFKETLPPIYPARTVQSSKPEMPANVYRTATPATPTVVQVPSSQYHQQYYGLSQVPPPSQQMAAVPNGAANFGYDYSHPMHDQVFYAQQTAPPLPSQYQTMTPTTAVLLTQATAQLAAENTTTQNRTS
ncbi:hypothetical protein HAX54_018064 [Datura stramonium]|uniref:PB1 domain-containing protein n=1 Tax=Datura stramonium TaxID=4076 RepID=A0ABS8S1E9_DATST|nr:hypothetical protein [Datura stramonium]